VPGDVSVSETFQLWLVGSCMAAAQYLLFRATRSKECDVYTEMLIGMEPYWPSDLVDHNVRNI
jgi:hypothetical protein